MILKTLVLSVLVLISAGSVPVLAQAPGRQPAAVTPSARSVSPATSTTAAVTFRRQRPDMRAMDLKIQRAITDLFLSYERRSTQSLRQLIGGDFRSRDSMGFGNGQSQFFLAVNGDFRNLRDINFDVVVQVPQYSADFRSARVDVQFSRKARFAVGGQEWIVRNQRTTFLMSTAPDLVRLSAIDGRPAMGMTNPMGVLIVDQGTVDGKPVNGPTPVVNGRMNQGFQDMFSYGTLRRQAIPGSGAGNLIPDLAVFQSSVVFSPNPLPANGSYTISIRVSNLGNAPSEVGAAAHVDFVIFNPANMQVAQGISQLPVIQPGGTQTFSFSFPNQPLGSSGTGFHRIFAQVQPQNPNFDRTNQNNNVQFNFRTQ